MNDKPVILIVDDRPQNIRLLETQLAPQGYEIVKAANGEEALGKLSGNQIDLILLDVKMPGMDGFEVTRRVRQDKTHRLLPIILVTVLRETEDRVKGFEAGCDDFISKPVDRMELFARVKSLLKVKAYNELMSNYQEELVSEVTRRTEESQHALESLQQEITERKQAEEALRQSEKAARRLAQENELIAEVGRIISSTLNIEKVYKRFAEKVREVIPFDHIVVNTVNMKDYTRTARYVAGGLIPDNYIEESFPLVGTRAENVVRTKSSIVINSKNREDMLKKFPGMLLQFGDQSMMMVPLISKDEVIGVMTVHSTKVDAYSENDLLLAERVGSQIAGAIANAQLLLKCKQVEKQLLDTLESLRNAVSTTIQVMVSAVEIRDPYTAGHQIRSADLARAIATEMGLPQEKIDGIRMAGSIHDIGKLSIPVEILSKPTKLSELEFSLIKEHARQGYEILKDVESPWPMAEIVRQHHERKDGSGYPRNLKGEEIMIEARILAVADVVEAMASHRPYRPGLGIDAALSEIEKNRGIFYDDAVADACLRLFREKGFKLEGT